MNNSNKLHLRENTQDDTYSKIYNISNCNVLFVGIYQPWYHVLVIESAMRLRLFTNGFKAWLVFFPPANLIQKETLE